LIRLIRSFAPDLVLTHRPNDYHADHRYTSTLVQDAAYMVTVPAVCPDVPHLERNPVIAYLSDDFKKPAPFCADIVVDVSSEIERMADMCHRHASQFYEWLPFNGGYLDQVPAGDAERRAWLGERLRKRLRPLADRCRDRLIETYGAEAGSKVQYVEAFEVSEYGAPLDAPTRERLFPFLPTGTQPACKQASEWADVRDGA
jgi:N-acetylglucosamine malate deacetylase 1